jgi:uncharacterized protein (TIGR00159 family)
MSFDLLKNFSLIDLIDILVVAFLIYRILLLIQGTRALQMLVGLATIFVVYVMAQFFQLMTLSWILNNFLSSIILVIVVLFQAEIRRGLARVGKNPFSSSIEEVDEGFVPELARAANTLANRKIGAIIVVERETGLSDYIRDGVNVDARATKEIITSIFLPTSPIHDGAIIIRRGRIVAAGCFFPLATDLEIHQDLGTRHRAALGISEESDAAVIVVSEERGEVSLVQGGKIYFNLDAESLEQRLRSLLG